MEGRLRKATGVYDDLVCARDSPFSRVPAELPRLVALHSRLAMHGIFFETAVHPLTHIQHAFKRFHVHSQTALAPA
jgi:hypothetical protein